MVLVSYKCLKSATLGTNSTGSHDLLSSYSRLIQVIASVDAVSLPFCASYARLFMRYNVQLDDPQTEVLEQSLARSVGELVNNGSDVWADVAASLGPRVAGRVSAMEFLILSSRN